MDLSNIALIGHSRGGWPFRDYAAVLGWNTGARSQGASEAAPDYTITLPEDLSRQWQLGPRTLLSSCLTHTDEKCEPPKNATDEQTSGTADTNEVNEPAGEAPQEDPTAPIDFTLELVASDGSAARLPLSHVRPLQRVLKVTFTKWPHWERIRCQSPSEPVLQTYEIPLADFVAANPAFNPAILKQIRFCFDRTESAVILLDQVGFTRAD